MKFKFAGGDGDQDYFKEVFLSVVVNESWFPSEILRGKALLLRIISGKRVGEYLAITSRQNVTLEEQIARANYISVVVHAVLNPGPGFIANNENLPAIGMAVIEIMDKRG